MGCNTGDNSNLTRRYILLREANKSYIIIIYPLCIFFFELHFPLGFIILHQTHNLSTLFIAFTIIWRVPNNNCYGSTTLYNISQNKLFTRSVRPLSFGCSRALVRDVQSVLFLQSKRQLFILKEQSHTKMGDQIWSHHEFKGIQSP